MGTGDVESRVVAPLGAEATERRVLVFGEFELDPVLYALRRRGEVVKLEPKVFDVLLHLVRHRDRVVAKAALLDALWPGEHVSESVLPRTINAVRAALGSAAREGRWIETVHRRGYRFVGDVEERAPDPASRATSDRSQRPSADPFVGRAGVMEELRAALVDALAGRPALALLAGEPGIGKSRSAEELAHAARERGIPVVAGACWADTGAPAFWPWVQVLRGVVALPGFAEIERGSDAAVADLAALLPELRGRLATPSPTRQVPADQARFRLFESVCELLARASESRGLLAILDDLHWADRSSLLLLEFLARMTTPSRMLVVATFRDTEIGQEHPLVRTLAELARSPGTRRIDLSGLERADVGRFLAQKAGGAPAEAWVARVHQATAGNPFFIRELVRWLGNEGFRFDDAASVPRDFDIPVQVREVIGWRLERLSRPCRTLLGVAAAVGAEFSLGVLAAAGSMPRETLLAALDEASRARVIQSRPSPPGCFAFAHALVRDTVYASLPAPERAALHGAIAEALEKLHRADLDAHAAELAQHFAAAAPLAHAAKAVEWCFRAAHMASRAHAFEASAAHHRRALDVLTLAGEGGDERRCELLLGLGEALRCAGEREAARESFAEAAELARAAGDAESLAAAALGYGGWAEYGGLPDEKLRALLEEARGALGDRPSAARARVLARLVGVSPYFWTREVRDALGREALEVARQSGDPAALGAALGARLWGLQRPDRLDERLAVASEALAFAERTGNGELRLWAHDQRLVTFLVLGDRAEVDREIEAHQRCARELRVPSARWFALRSQVSRAAYRGRFEEAERLMREAVDCGTRAGNPYAGPNFVLHAYMILRERGTLARVLAAVDVDKLLTPFEVKGLTLPRGTIAYLQSRLGGLEKARRIFEEAARDDFASLARDEDWLHEIADFADVCIALGDAERAAVLSRLLEPYAHLHLVHGVAGLYAGPAAYRLGRLAALLGRVDQAAAYFESAIQAAERAGARPYLARSQLEYARLLARRGRRGEARRARELARAAEAAAREMGMVGVASEAAAFLSEEGS